MTTVAAAVLLVKKSRRVKAKPLMLSPYHRHRVSFSGLGNTLAILPDHATRITGINVRFRPEADIR
jgi:hypothetical protein